MRRNGLGGSNLRPPGSGRGKPVGNLVSRQYKIRKLMISVAAIRMQQFGVQFYQASLSANDIDKLVRFEVLSYGEQAQPVRGGRKKTAAPSKVNWDLLERRIAANEKAYQRQIIRRKIDELVQYYEQCRQARDLPPIAGAVIISSDETLKFEAVCEGLSLGALKG